MHRERTADLKNGFKGVGQHVTTNMLESSLYSLSYVAGSYLNGDYNYTRMGNRHQTIAPYSVFKTADNEWIVIGVATDKQFQTLKSVIGIPDSLGIFDTN